MTRYFILLSLIITLGSGAIATEPKEIDQALTRAFIPVGFDDNDSIQIMVAGKFKNSCYQVGMYSSMVNEARKEIEVRLTAYEYDGRCLQVHVPFFQEIHLGMVGRVGTYSVIDGTSKAVLGSLTIGKSPETGTGMGTDTDTYAPLLDAYLTNLKQPTHTKLVLTGIFPNSCITIDKIKTHLYDDVLVVLPTIKYTGRENCTTGEFAFKTSVQLKEVLPQTFLLHVRSMGGQAINKVVINGSSQ